MADPISVQCPHCKVKLKLKAAPPAGKKIGCPKCKKPFPIKAPAKKKESDEDFLDALDDLAEDDYEAPEDEDSENDEEDAPPARSSMRSKGGASTKKVGKGKKGRSKKSSAGPILAIIGGSVAALALIGGLVYLLMNLTGGAGRIRSASGEFIAFVPADADVYVAARPADIMASPLLASVVQNPQAKQGFADIEKSFGFPLTEVEHVFAAVKVDRNAARAGQQAVPMGGNPMMGMPPGLPGMPGMGGGNRSGLQDAVFVLRLKQPYGGKGLDQIRQQFPPKTHKDVSYHVSTDPNGGAFFFGDDRHVIVTEPSWVERIIERKDQAENNNLLAYFAKTQHFTMVAIQNGTAAQSTLPPGFSQAFPNQNLQKLAQEISMVRLDLNMPAGVDLKVTVTCKTDSAAQQMHAETTKGIDTLKQQAQGIKFIMPDAGSEIDSVLNSLKVNLAGTNIDVAVSIPSATIDRLKKMAAPQPGAVSPGAAGFPPPQSTGTFPPGALPPGVPQPTNLPPGTTPGTIAPGTIPTGSIPAGTVPPQN